MMTKVYIDGARAEVSSGHGTYNIPVSKSYEELFEAAKQSERKSKLVVRTAATIAV
jgi:hypothetical protein